MPIIRYQSPVKVKSKECFTPIKVKNSRKFQTECKTPRPCKKIELIEPYCVKKNISPKKSTNHIIPNIDYQYEHELRMRADR